MTPTLRRVFFSAAILCILGSVAAQTHSRVFELQSLAPQFWNLVAHDAKLDVVATGFGFTEGPIWDPAGFLYVSDETINKIFRVFPDGKKEAVMTSAIPTVTHSTASTASLTAPACCAPSSR
jgi:gluconolactonase